MASDTTKTMPFIKNLASSNRKLRTASLTQLRSFLQSRRSSSRRLSQTDCLKLWKSLFFALWMTDRPIPQQHLCSELASLHDLLPRDSVGVWWAAFWEVMAMEWTTGIDVLRMNKFLLLVRRVVGGMVGWGVRRRGGGRGTGMGDNGEVEETAEETVLRVLREWPLEEEGDLRKVPTGLRLHVLDVLVDEMDAAGMLKSSDSDVQSASGKGGEDGQHGDDEHIEEDEGEEEEKSFARRIAELVKKLERCPVKAVRARAVEFATDKRLPWNEKADSDGEEDAVEVVDRHGLKHNDAWGGFDD